MKLTLSILAMGLATASAHPIQKVIDQMVDLRIKAKEEGEAEALAYQKFSHWCGTETEKLNGKIAKNNEKISGFESAIEGFEASIAALKDEISQLKDEIAKREADQAKADELRKTEKGIYKQKKQDLEDTIKAIADAHEALKGSKSVLQIRASIKKAAVIAGASMSAEQRHTIHSFLQSEIPEVVEDPTKARVRKYDFKSGSVLELLESLRDEFKAELLDTEKAETNAVNGHDLSTQAQNAAIDAAQKAQSEKEKILADTESDLATAQTDLDDERRDLELNQETLKETTTECTNRHNEFEERSAAREGEQAALSEAVAILSKVTGLRNPLTQEIAKKATMFLQLAKPVDQKKEAKEKAINLIMSAAKKSHNGMLQRLGQQLRVAKGPFKQIKNMIQKMIFRLNKEQQDEDAHKNWCDTELETTTQQRDEKSDQVDEMTAKVESLTAKIEDLSEALAEAEESVADTQKYMKDETDLRAENKADNEQTIADAKEAQAALAQAIGVLTQYYKDSGAIEKKDWEFMQTAKPALDYDGSFSNTDGSSAVMSLLEECLGDYSKMEAEATAAEESESENFEQDMKENKIALAKLRNEIKVKTARKTTLEEDKASTASQLKKGEKQLEALNQYLKDLDQPCVAGDSSYDDRKAARKSEIDSLYEALNVLADAFKPKEFLQRN